MSDTQDELQPLVPGAVKVESSEREKLDFPVGKMIQVHITEGRHGKFPKEVERDGEKKTIIQHKVFYTFQVDSDVKDATTKESLLGKTFSKSITLSDHERATYPGFITAALGEYSAEPADAIGKPLQVIFGQWSKFGESDYQPVTYLPPAEGKLLQRKTSS
jgi:hypothetical protein